MLDGASMNLVFVCLIISLHAVVDGKLERATILLFKTRFSQTLLIVKVDVKFPDLDAAKIRRNILWIVRYVLVSLLFHVFVCFSFRCVFVVNWIVPPRN